MNSQYRYDKYKRNKQSRQFYKSTAWAKARELALKRDNYLCQSCLSKKIIRAATTVHHVRELSDYPELATTLSNLISWCASCHSSHHKTGIRQNKAPIKKVSSKINVIETKANEEMF